MFEFLQNLSRKQWLFVAVVVAAIAFILYRTRKCASKPKPNPVPEEVPGLPEIVEVPKPEPAPVEDTPEPNEDDAEEPVPVNNTPEIIDTAPVEKPVPELPAIAPRPSIPSENTADSPQWWTN